MNFCVRRPAPGEQLMSISIGCQECGRLLLIEDVLPETQITCPYCGSVQAIPSAATFDDPFGCPAKHISANSSATIPIHLETYLATPAKAWDVLVNCLSSYYACELLSKES